MALKRTQRMILTGTVILIVFFTAYGWFFRTYMDSDQYLRMAYDYTGRDPTIINWEEPDFEIIEHQGRLAIHIIFYTTEDETRGPIGLYIDPFRKLVFDEDSRKAADPDT
jgi:hypothetical protein